MMVFDPSGVPVAGGLPTLSVLMSRSTRKAFVAFIGEIDISVADHVADAIALAGGWEGVGELEADVSGVSFIDVAGLRALLRTGAELGDRGRQFALSFAENGPVGRLLTLCQSIRIADAASLPTFCARSSDPRSARNAGRDSVHGRKPLGDLGIRVKLPSRRSAPKE
jgi:anti-anti-sigma factor